MFCLVFYLLTDWLFELVESSGDMRINHRLRILVMELPGFLTAERNATGHITSMSDEFGKLMLDFLSELYHFHYTLLPIYAPQGDDTPTRKGAISYVKEKEVDLLWGVLRATNERFKWLDFPPPFISAPFTVLIPFPQAGSSAKRISAILTPLDWTVWLLIPPTTAVVVLSLFAFYKPKGNRKLGPSAIFNCLFTYAGKLNRWVLAAWCLFTFFLVQIYSSTLTSHLTSPLQKPIIQSVYDIPKVPGIKVTVHKDYAPDVYLQNSKSGVLKQIGDMIRLQPDSRCVKLDDCLAKSMNEPYVHINILSSALLALAKDRKSTGTCHFTVTKETFVDQYGYIALPKNSPYTQAFSIGILRLAESGLLAKWSNEVMKITECTKYKEQKRDNDLVRLSIQHLSGAFVLLAVGYAIALIAFTVERMRFKHSNR